jgi:hypothetical protein
VYVETPQLAGLRLDSASPRHNLEGWGLVSMESTVDAADMSNERTLFVEWEIAPPNVMKWLHRKCPSIMLMIWGPEKERGEVKGLA